MALDNILFRGFQHTISSKTATKVLDHDLGFV